MSQIRQENPKGVCQEFRKSMQDTETPLSVTLEESVISRKSSSREWDKTQNIAPQSRVFISTLKV